MVSQVYELVATGTVCSPTPPKKQKAAGVNTDMMCGPAAPHMIAFLNTSEVVLLSRTCRGLLEATNKRLDEDERAQLVAASHAAHYPT